jgi:hypothetical protein
MSARGYYKARDVGTLNAAQAELIAACGGPSEAAGKCSVGKSVLQAASDKDQSKRFLSTRTVVELEAACDQPIVTRFLAAERGCIVEQVRRSSSRPLALILGKITSEFGELLTAAAIDAANGKLTKGSAAILLDETDDVICALVDFRAKCREARDRGE